MPQDLSLYIQPADIVGSMARGQQIGMQQAALPLQMYRIAQQERQQTLQNEIATQKLGLEQQKAKREASLANAKTFAGLLMGADTPEKFEKAKGVAKMLGAEDVDKYTFDMRDSLLDSMIKAEEVMTARAKIPLEAAGAAAKAQATLPYDLAKASASRPQTNVNVNTAANPFLKSLGDKAGEGLFANVEKAKSAVRQLEASDRARDLLDQGMITGTGANFRLSVARALKTAGITGDEKVENTEAFISAMGRQTLDLVKGLGAGSGISNADREYAERIAGGNIELSEQGLRRIIDLNERASRAFIEQHNRDIQPVLKDASLPEWMKPQLTVEAPAPRKSGGLKMEVKKGKAVSEMTDDELRNALGLK